VLQQFFLAAFNRAKVPADYVIASNSKIFAARLLRARQLNVRYSSTSDFIKQVILKYNLSTNPDSSIHVSFPLSYT